MFRAQAALKLHSWAPQMGYTEPPQCHNWEKLCKGTTVAVLEDIIARVRPRKEVKRFRKNLFVAKLLRGQIPKNTPVCAVETKFRQHINQTEHNIADQMREIEDLKFTLRDRHKRLRILLNKIDSSKQSIQNFELKVSFFLLKKSQSHLYFNSMKDLTKVGKALKPSLAASNLDSSYIQEVLQQFLQSEHCTEEFRQNLVKQISGWRLMHIYTVIFDLLSERLGRMNKVKFDAKMNEEISKALIVDMFRTKMRVDAQCAKTEVIMKEIEDVKCSILNADKFQTEDGPVAVSKWLNLLEQETFLKTQFEAETKLLQKLKDTSEPSWDISHTGSEQTSQAFTQRFQNEYNQLGKEVQKLLQYFPRLNITRATVKEKLENLTRFYQQPSVENSGISVQESVPGSRKREETLIDIKHKSDAVMLSSTMIDMTTLSHHHSVWDVTGIENETVINKPSFHSSALVVRDSLSRESKLFAKLQLWKIPKVTLPSGDLVPEHSLLVNCPLQMNKKYGGRNTALRFASSLQSITQYLERKNHYCDLLRYQAGKKSIEALSTLASSKLNIFCSEAAIHHNDCFNCLDEIMENISKTLESCDDNLNILANNTIEDLIPPHLSVNGGSFKHWRDMFHSASKD